jgi:predicted dehydrogenase
MKRVRVGLVGSGFVSTIHAAALARVPAAEVVAVVSPTPGHARAFAARHAIPHAFENLADLLALDALDLVVIGCPNDQHAEVCEQAAAAGKHVVCEKPLALSLAEADRMIAACQRAGVKLMYAEELCFAPKYVRLKHLLDGGALGRPTFVKQSEKHDGPHAAWFWDVGRSGGGVTLDMGCHAIEFFRWMLATPEGPTPGDAHPANSGEQTRTHEPSLDRVVPLKKPRPLSVYADMATLVHADRTQGEDHALLIVRFETPGGEVVALAEESWGKKGGMDDRAEVHGTGGVAYADLIHGNAILAYSDTGYDYAVEKAGTTRGWSFPVFEELWNYGFPQEFAHFVDCVAHDRQPLETGEDGRAVLEILLAAYESAGTGRRVALPFASDAARPITLWKRGT